MMRGYQAAEHTAAQATSVEQAHQASEYSITPPPRSFGSEEAKRTVAYISGAGAFVSLDPLLSSSIRLRLGNKSPRHLLAGRRLQQPLHIPRPLRSTETDKIRVLNN